MSRGRIAVAALVLVGLVVALVWWLRPDDERETATVTRGSIDVTIETVGVIQLADDTPIRTYVSGEVVAIGASDGDRVEAGDILVLLDDEDLARGVRDAEEALEAAEFALQFIELRLENEPDNPALQQEAIGALQRVTTAERALEEARERRRAGAILSPQRGTVIDIMVSPGDRLNANQPVALVRGDDGLLLVADVDELDLPNVRPGTLASFRLDAAPATEIKGIVIRTAPQAVQRGGATLFPTDIAFVADPDLDIRPGMNASVTIQTDLREDVLLVPERAIRTVGERAFVIVREDGEEREVEVQLGYRSAGMAEVVSGLQEGQTVVLR
ncbi:MAG TPA: efflux RND transporter periplasmic adaptor subunit [Thermomicrobiales bacterium]|nr:efflux RND transporter periplasmic adaptor subunit [Thermomicrobiales bacterium]